MNHPPNNLEQRIDSALSQLPRWEPPADFTARLAAAAARQSMQPAISPSLLRVGALLRLLSDSALAVIACLAVAGFLAWGIPWNSLAQSSQQVGWAGIIALVASSVWATRRALSRS